MIRSKARWFVSLLQGASCTHYVLASLFHCLYKKWHHWLVTNELVTISNLGQNESRLQIHTYSTIHCNVGVGIASEFGSPVFFSFNRWDLQSSVDPRGLYSSWRIFYFPSENIRLSVYCSSLILLLDFKITSWIVMGSEFSWKKLTNLPKL